MTTRLLLLLSAVIAFVGLAGALAISAERLGDWTDAHPDRALLAWSLWNLSLVVVVVGLGLAWRRYRRSARTPVR